MRAVQQSRLPRAQAGVGLALNFQETLRRWCTQSECAQIDISCIELVADPRVDDSLELNDHIGDSELLLTSTSSLNGEG
jgi:hypothetical protein